MIKRLQKIIFSPENLPATFFIFFFLISSLFLFISANNHLIRAKQEGWWTLYFNDPKSQSVDFTIRNDSEDSNFHWEIFMDKTRVQQGEVFVKRDEIKTITVKSIDLKEKKVVISATDNQKNKKEIYKIISN